jgi:hypothetical protein
MIEMEINDELLPGMNDSCPHCHMPKNIRNPSGWCDHLQYPDNCDVCQTLQRERIRAQRADRYPHPDLRDLRIMSLSAKIDELEKDKVILIDHLKHLSDLSLKAFERDAECRYCQARHAEMEEQHSCF